MTQGTALYNALAPWQIKLALRAAQCESGTLHCIYLDRRGDEPTWTVVALGKIENGKSQ